MKLQYITDGRGNKSGVQLPIQEWERIQKDLDELDRFRKKELFLSELSEAIDELKQVKEGKVKSRSAKEFIDDL